MFRTIRIPYIASEPGFGMVLADLRRRQCRAIRMAYCQLSAGTAPRDLYRALRSHPVGQEMHTWLLLSGITKARALHRLRPDGKVVFGGRRRLIERSQGKITSEEWKAKRLWPLTIEGHAKSYGKQGGNHLVTLDIAQKRLVVHGPGNIDYELTLKLSGRSHAYRRRLLALQERCETVRDIPFSVTINEREVSIGWNAIPSVASAPSKPKRVLSLDLNPGRIGWTVVEDDKGCRCVAWGVFEFSGLNRPSKLAPDEPRSKAIHNKRRYELAVLPKEIVSLARHYEVAAVVFEKLSLGAKDHGKGRRFNRLVNQCWFRAGFLQPLLRRIEEAGFAHHEVNPAYSSLIGTNVGRLDEYPGSGLRGPGDRPPLPLSANFHSGHPKPAPAAQRRPPMEGWPSGRREIGDPRGMAPGVEATQPQGARYAAPGPKTPV